MAMGTEQSGGAPAAWAWRAIAGGFAAEQGSLRLVVTRDHGAWWTAAVYRDGRELRHSFVRCGAAPERAKRQAEAVAAAILAVDARILRAQ